MAQREGGVCIRKGRRIHSAIIMCKSMRRLCKSGGMVGGESGAHTHARSCVADNIWGSVCG
eukprot:22026-Chlamydomonas_euryale.AAC.1